VLELIRHLDQRPEPYAPGDTPFWTDSRLSEPLLSAHLDPTSDAASRRPETIAREVEWIVDALHLAPGAEVLDLGCGPGLYAVALAERGLSVTGIDLSTTAIAHARGAAEAAGLEIRFVHGDYRELDETDTYDAALLVYLDFGVLPEWDRLPLLERIHAALLPGGRLVVDVVSTAAHRPDETSWSASLGGFWRPGPHLVLERRVDFPELDLSCSEHAVVEPSGETALYRFWEQRFSQETIGRLLEEAGFAVEQLVADLSGTPWADGSEAIAVVARRE
jgi:SAM-dependent methyltransferase